MKQPSKMIFISFVLLLVSCNTERYHQFSKVKVSQENYAHTQASIQIGLISSKTAISQKALVKIDNLMVCKFEHKQSAPSAHIIPEDLRSSHKLVEFENEIASRSIIECRDLSQPAPEKGHLPHKDYGKISLLFALSAIIYPVFIGILVNIVPNLAQNNSAGWTFVIINVVVIPLIFVALAIIYGIKAFIHRKKKRKNQMER